MKKIILITLILAVALSLIACSESKEPSNAGEKTAASQTGEKTVTSQTGAGSANESTAKTTGTASATGSGASQNSTAASSVNEGTTKATQNGAEGSDGLTIQDYGDSCIVYDIGSFKGTELVIPSYVNGKPVTHIEEDALSNDTMISLFIPSTVVSIGEDAVSESANLESVIFSEGLIGIGYGSFGNCPKLKSVFLPSTLERIGNSGFRCCFSLEEAVLAGNADIGNSAFTECPSLKKVSVEGKNGRAYSVKSSAFESDMALEEVSFSEGLETIGAFCFSGCASLKTVYLPATLKKIESSAFLNVGDLKVIYAGSEDEWKSISVAQGNDPLTGAEITYNKA